MRPTISITPSKPSIGFLNKEGRELYQSLFKEKKSVISLSSLGVKLEPGCKYEIVPNRNGILSYFELTN